MNPQEKFERLWTDFLEGDLSPDGLGELTLLLDQFPELRQKAADALEIHRLLGFLAARTSRTDLDFVRETLARLPRSSESFVEATMKELRSVPSVSFFAAGRKFWTDWRVLAAAASILLMASAWLWTTRPVAKLGTLDGCRWVNVNSKFEPGDPLHSGERLELSAGRAEIVFSCGAVTTLQGPCIFELESVKSGFLMLGEAETRAESVSAHGFKLRTRTAEIVDLGTAFVTSADATGGSHVAVTSGDVVIHFNGGRAPEHLRAGERLSLEPGPARVTVRVERGDETPGFHFPTIEPPSDSDYADARQGHARISVASGILKLMNPGRPASGPVEALLDGKGQSTSDSPTESVFFADNTEGSLLLDLGNLVSIEKINTYSWHKRDSSEFIRFRAQQKYVLYGFAGETPPAVDGELENAGWRPIARVNTDEYFGVAQPLYRPPQQACSITSQTGTLGRYRYLLWAVKPVRLPNSQAINHTFYGEFDVYAHQ